MVTLSLSQKEGGFNLETLGFPMLCASRSPRYVYFLYMITPEVVAFIKDQDAKGVSRESTRLTLMSQGGWTGENIEEAFAVVPTIYAAPTDGTPRPPLPLSVSTYVEKKPNMLVMGLSTVFSILFVFMIGAAAAYFFVPGIEEDVRFIMAALAG